MTSQTREAPFPPPALWQAMARADTSPVILISAQTGDVLYANRMAHHLVGDDATRPGRHAAEVFPLPIAAAVESVRRDGQPIHQHGLRLPEGPDHADARFWDIAYAAFANDTGTAPAILVTAHDVTHHVLARQVAEQAGNTLDALLDHVPEGITIAYGPQVHVARVSAAGIEMARRSSLELVGQDAAMHGNAWDIYGPDGITPIPAEGRPLARAIQTGQVTHNEMLILRRPDGTKLPLLCSAGPIRNGAGAVIGAVLCWRDVTDIIAAQTALASNEARLRAILQQIPSAIFIVESADGAITFQNDRLGKVLASSTPAILGAGDHLPGSALHEDGTPYRLEEYPTRRAFSKGVTIEAEPIIFRRRDGEILRLENYAAPVRDAQGHIVAAVGVLYDVTARRNREEALREALAARELLLREADHRIKNSLQLICSILTLQRTRLDTPDLRAVLDDAISRVLAVAEAHRALHQSTDLRTVDFGTMLDDLCRHAATLSPAIAFTHDCPTPVDLDTERAIPLGLMVSELLTNAAKYAYGVEGGPVRLSAISAGGLITITVADRGRGIPGGAARGQGIGSKIVASMAKQIGATVATASGPGGTVVTLTFAQQQDQP
jgi:PAS domain S-box-containing protein